jgi:hypothetical protein
MQRLRRFLNRKQKVLPRHHQESVSQKNQGNALMNIVWIEKLIFLVFRNLPDHTDPLSNIEEKFARAREFAEQHSQKLNLSKTAKLKHIELQEKSEESWTKDEKLFMEYANFVVENRRIILQARYEMRQKLRDQAVSTDNVGDKISDDMIVDEANPAQEMETELKF